MTTNFIHFHPPLFGTRGCLTFFCRPCARIGATIQQLFLYVSEFYAKNPVQKADISQLRSSIPRPLSRSRSPGTGESLNRVPGSATAAVRDQPAFWGVPNLEEDFQDFIWDLLRVEEDLIVGKESEGNRLSLGEILNDLRNVPGTGGKSAQGENVGEGVGREWKVYAAEDRRWRTLTGHGPDPKKVFFSTLAYPAFVRNYR